MRNIYTVIVSIIMLTCLMTVSVVADNQPTSSKPVDVSVTDSKLKPYQYYMKKLVENAKKNPRSPFAAMIVDRKTGKILSEGINDSLANPTYHGEMRAIDEFVKKHKNIDWSNTILLTTGEPCSMCMSAIIWAKIPVVVYGTAVPFLIKHGWPQIDIRARHLSKIAPFYKGEIIGGILREETDKLFINGPLKKTNVSGH